MPTYRLSARSQFRTPSGAVGDPPDGPGGMAALSDDVDNFLGVGGAEYAANATAVAAIPAGRKFPGKLMYKADTDVVYRYVGGGNTALGANTPSTNVWQAWEKPATAFVPAWTTITIGSSTVLAQWGITAGVTWMSVNVTGGASYAISSTANDVSFTAPSPVVCGLGIGGGLYSKAGSGANNNQVDLACFPTGTNAQATTAIRIRAKYANAAPGPVTENVLGFVITSTATDSFQVTLSAPSALVG